MNKILTAFLAQAKTSQTFWALQDKESEDWVILDSVNFEDTEVMPLWSDKALAQSHCIEEWREYSPAEISVADWLEFWIEDLKEDNIVIGIDWQGEEEYLELDLADFSQAIAEIEAL